MRTPISGCCSSRPGDGRITGRSACRQPWLRTSKPTRGTGATTRCRRGISQAGGSRPRAPTTRSSHRAQGWVDEAIIAAPSAAATTLHARRVASRLGRSASIESQIVGVGFHLCAQELPYHPVGRRALVCSLEDRVLRIADDRTTPAINQHQLFLYSQCDFHVLPRWTVGHTCAMMPAMRAPVPAVYNRAAAPDPAAARRHLRAGWRQSRHDSSGRGHNDNRQTV